jgi:amidohydrolase
MNEPLITNIKALAESAFDDVVAFRRNMHQHPELSFQEEGTAKIIAEFLDKLGCPYTTGWAGYGIVATIKGNTDGPAVMLRADMDALPIQELNDVSYRSAHDGIMHACGHDVHSASLLGAATILMQLRDHIAGSVLLLFQPGEEKLPGGASIMIREGLFEKYNPTHIIAQHVFPSLPAGNVGFRNGLYMASADELSIRVKGKGGHAATPHQAIDPIVTASRIVLALQDVINRTKDPVLPGLLTIGKFNSIGGATNVIPDEVQLEGTLRAMDETWRFEAHKHIERIVRETAAAAGAEGITRIEVGYPCLVNDDRLTDQCRHGARLYAGDDQVHELPQRMTSEDFAFYTHHIPATFFRLGTGFLDQDNPPVHSSRFNVNEEALKTGMGLLAYLALTTTS